MENRKVVTPVQVEAAPEWVERSSIRES